MSASNHQQSNMNNSEYCSSGDQENYINSKQGSLKYEEEQIYINDDSNDSFNEKRKLITNNSTLRKQCENSYQTQQNKLNAIKNLINPFDNQTLNQNNSATNIQKEKQFISNQLQNPNNDFSSNLNQGSNKSKKEILKEKRDKKKLQIQEKKITTSEETNSDEMNQTEKKKEYSKEEKAERQKIKNRESAQLSRDRKKEQENMMQQDLKFLTEENKQLQSLINKQYTCQSCGYQNNPQQNNNSEYNNSCSSTKLFSNCKENHINTLNPDSIQFRSTQYNQNFDSSNLQQCGENTTNSSVTSNPVYQFFDFSRTNAPLMSSSPINFCGFGKGVWSTTFVIFVLYMLLVFSGTQQDGNATLGSNFRNLQFVGPYNQFFEQYKNFTQEQLLEELLLQIQKLKESEREEQLQQLKLIQMIANAASTANNVNVNEPSTTTELNQSQKTSISVDNEKDLIIEESQSQVSSSTTQTNNLYEKIQALEKEVSIESKSAQQNFLDFCKQFKEIQSSNQNEQSYYKDLSQKLDELQKEKLMQLEALKQIYCINTPDTPAHSQEDTSSQQQNSQEQFFVPKIQLKNPYFTEKQLSNPAFLQDSTIEKLHNTVDQAYNNGAAYNEYNNNLDGAPTFDNISQFFNETASFEEEDLMNSSQNSSQNLNTEEEHQQQQQEYQQYRSMIRINQHYQNQQIDIEEDNNHIKESQVHLVGEEEDPFNVSHMNTNNRQQGINYYELMQKKNTEQPQQEVQRQNQGYIQQIACQYTFQQNPRQLDEYQNSNSTNSINLQSIQNGRMQQFNLLFSPYQGAPQNAQNGVNDQQMMQNQEDKQIKFSCKFVDDNCFKKDSY